MPGDHLLAADPDDDRRCISCGYPLRGLQVGASCPECGFRIKSQRKTDVSLDHAAPAVVHGVAWRFISTFLAVLLVAPGIYIGMYFAFDARDPALVLSLGIVMPIGSWLLTCGWQESSAIYNKLGPANTLRRLARWGATCWILFGLFGMLGAQSASWPAPLVMTIALAKNLSLVGGLLQLIFLGIILERYASWMRDDFAMQLIRFVPFLIGITLLNVLAGLFVNLVYNSTFPVFQSISSILVLLVFVGALFLLGRLAKNAFFAILHMRHNIAADERTAEQRRLHEQEMASRSAGNREQDGSGHP